MKYPALSLCVFLLSTTVSPAALIALFDFEEGSGATTTDASGNSRVGTLGDGASWDTNVFAPGGSTASIFFDGTDNANVAVASWKAPEIGDTNSRSIALWMRSADGVLPGASNLGFIGYGENQAGDKFNFRTQIDNGPIDGNIRVEVNGGYIIGTTVVVDGLWHHVAMTWEDDGTPDVLDVKLYVDGQLEEISASLDEIMHTDTTNGIDFTIADDHSNREWHGWLDDIRVYDHALSGSDIAALAVPEPSASLLGLFGFSFLLLKRRR
ncbi:MAG: LamG domain-containing protein [Verrucomicrobiales bacterium]